MLNLTAEERDYITYKLIQQAISVMDLKDLEIEMSIAMREGMTGYDEYSDEDLWDTFMDTFDELWKYADDSKEWDHKSALIVLKMAHEILPLH